MKRAIVFSVVAGLFLSGCTTTSKDIAASYVSPLQYQSYDCEQIVAEGQRLNTKVVQLGGRLDEAAANDKSITVVGAFLFWPALFALGGTKGQEAEFARLTGERDALQQVAIQKKCGLGPGSGTTMASASAPPAVAAAVMAPAPAAPAQVVAVAVAVTAPAAPAASPRAALAAAPPVSHAVQFPGPYGSLVLTDSLTKVKRKIVVQVDEVDEGKTYYSTGDVIADNGSVLATRVGELVIRADSGALWVVPVKAGTSGDATFVTTTGGFKGRIRWQATAEDASTVRIAATTYWSGGGAGGSFVASYKANSPVAQSFKTEIYSPMAASYAQGYAPSDRTSGLLTRP